MPEIPSRGIFVFAEPDQPTVYQSDSEIVVITQSHQGPPGPPGPDLGSLAKRTSYVPDVAIYKGEAAAGSADSNPVWRIRKIDLTGDGAVLWADGTDTYDKVWTDHASLTYL